MTIETVTRFAPSPTGPLHIGHAYAAFVAADLAAAQSGRFLLRIEDIDRSRARPQWETQIYEDLQWLGLSWPKPVLRQSDRADIYVAALDRLWRLGVLYPCTCKRRDIQAAVSAPQDGVPLLGPDGLIYPGTCRNRHDRAGARPNGVALRLDMLRALDTLGIESISFEETGPYKSTLKQIWGKSALIDTVGDVVLSRVDMGASYHLCVVGDDHAQAVSLVTRGQDLADATSIHVLLQQLLDLDTPKYHHHRLIRDRSGKRLAKRDDARAIATYRDDGFSPADILELVAFKPLAP